MWNKALLILLLVTAPGIVQAYLDPGSGVTFVSGIGAYVLGFLALVFGGVMVFFKRLVRRFKKRPPS